jgi:hypothetical protein
VTDDAQGHAPRSLVGAAVLVGLEGLFFVVLALLELFALHAKRATLAISTGLFFLLLAAGLVACAWGLLRVRSWARGPVVALELIGVLLSFSFWGGDTRLGSLVILLVSLATLFCVLHPASTRALAAAD